MTPETIVLNFGYTKLRKIIGEQTQKHLGTLFVESSKSQKYNYVGKRACRNILDSLPLES